MSSQITFHSGRLVFNVSQHAFSNSTYSTVQMPACSNPNANPPAPANNSIAVTLSLLTVESNWLLFILTKSIISSGCTFKTIHKSLTLVLRGLYSSDSITDNWFFVIPILLASSAKVLMPCCSIISFILTFDKYIQASAGFLNVVILY